MYGGFYIELPLPPPSHLPPTFARLYVHTQNNNRVRFNYYDLLSSDLNYYALYLQRVHSGEGSSRVRGI